MPRVFPSKVDWLLAAAPLLIVANAGVGIEVAGTRLPVAVRAIVLIAILAVLCLSVWTMLATDYTLDAHTLTVRCGPFRWRIPLSEIRAVTATRDPSSGPALSLDRLRVEYGPGRALLISPRDASRFVGDLDRLRHAPGEPSAP